MGLGQVEDVGSPEARVLRALLALVGGLLSAFIGLVLTWMPPALTWSLLRLHPDGHRTWCAAWPRLWGSSGAVAPPRDRPRSAIWLASLVFVGSLHFVAWAAWMWSPPSVEVCRAVADAEGDAPVEAWPQEPSHPYDLLYIEEEGGWWRPSDGRQRGASLLGQSLNRVLAVNVRDRRNAQLPVSGRPLPQMTYAATSRELLVSRMGPVTNILDVVDRRAPELVARSREVPFQVMRLSVTPSGQYSACLVTTASSSRWIKYLSAL